MTAGTECPIKSGPSSSAFHHPQRVLAMIIRSKGLESAAIAAAIVAMTSVAATAQGIGTIEQVKPVAQSACNNSSAAKRDQYVNRQRRGVSTPLAPPFPSTLLANDTIIVGRASDARLQINSTPYGHGMIALAPLLPCPGWAGWRVVNAVRTDFGVYTTRVLRGRGARGDTLELDIERGGAYIQWDKSSSRPLVVRGGEGPRMIVTGTELLVTVDGARHTWLFVRSGTVRIEGAAAAIAGQFYEIRPTGPVVVPNATPSTPQLLADADYHGTSIWTDVVPAGTAVGAAGGLSIGALLGGAALIGGAAYGGYEIYKHVSSPSTATPPKTTTGVVIIRIPF